MLQRNSKLLLAILFFLSFVFVPKTQAQMMGNFILSVTPSAQDIRDIQTGQELYYEFQNNKISCRKLGADDFEKIGEYVMDQRFDNTSQHIQMNNNMKQMMGEQSEENMHIKLGKTATGCSTNSLSKGGVPNMMGWGYSGMMSAGFGFLGTIVWIVVLIDLILLGIWLWKKVQK